MFGWLVGHATDTHQVLLAKEGRREAVTEDCLDCGKVGFYMDHASVKLPQ